MSFFSRVNGGGFATVIPSGDEPRDPRTGRLLRELTARQLEVIYEHSPHLRKLGIEPCDQRKLPEPELRGMWNGSPIVDISRKARESALLRDPLPTRKAPTKPEYRRYRQPERALAVAYHEAGHCALAVMLGQRALSATICPQDTSDGHTVLQNSGDIGIECCMDLAGQVADELSGVPMAPANYSTDNKRWPAAMRDEMKPLVRKYLTESWGAVDEIAKQLLLNETLDEFKIKLAYVRGLQKMKASVQRSNPKQQQDLRKVAPKEGRVLREYDFSKQADIRAWNKQIGNENVDAEPIGFGVGHIVQGSYR